MAEPIDAERNYPRDLLALLAALTAEIALETEQLRLKQQSVDDWQRELLRLLMAYTAASVMLAQDSDAISAEAEQIVADTVTAQAAYLSRFAAEMSAEMPAGAMADAWQDGWAARAELYAESVRAPYWQTVVYGLNIPFPGDGSSICGAFDRCWLTIQWLDAKNGDADVWWNLAEGEGVEHCATCVKRNRDWRPLAVRGGEPQAKA